MRWKKFKEEIPEFDKPIFVYRPTGGVLSFFTKNDDIRPCTLTQIQKSSEGFRYYLKGYDYGSIGLVGFVKDDFMEMEWLEVPKR